MSKTWLVTGAAGFIGSQVVRELAKLFPDDAIRCVDYCSAEIMQLNLGEAFNKHRSILGIRTHYANETSVEMALDADYILHLAAETHVDTSIDEPSLCVENNYREFEMFLRQLRQRGFKGRLVYVSTDEVYGDRAGKLRAAETAAVRCSNVYAATKAGAEQLCMAYCRTYGMDIVITRGANTFGPRQAPEKFVPRSLYLLSQVKPLQLYGAGKATREWLHVEDHAMGVLQAATKGKCGEIYNLGGAFRSTGLALAEMLIRHVFPGASSEEVRNRILFVPDRPGHDMDYRIHSNKAINALEWHMARKPYAQAWAETIQWYLDNEVWLETMQKHGVTTERQGQQLTTIDNPIVVPASIGGTIRGVGRADASQLVAETTQIVYGAEDAGVIRKPSEEQ
jgi:dTDP-glucose 4,6-dehydratase